MICAGSAPTHPAFISASAYLASLPPGALPTRCPACGDPGVAALFWPDPSLDLWDCANPACHAVFCWRD